MNNVTAHAMDRAEGRLRAAGLDPAKVAAKGAAIAAATRGHWDSVAVMMTTLPTAHGDDRDDIMSRESNGNEVWCVCRQGRLVTVMFRRSDQPKRPDCFGVERVLRMTR